MWDVKLVQLNTLLWLQYLTGYLEEKDGMHLTFQNIIFLEGHRKRFPKLVKMLVLYIKINFSPRYINFFLEIKLQWF